MSYIRKKWEELDNLTNTLTNNLSDLKTVVYNKISAKYPKMFTKGIGAHGYGGNHYGMGYMDRLNLSNDTISGIGWGSGARHYAAALQDNDFKYGYAFGSLNANDPDNDDCPANKVEGATKTIMATETQVEVTDNINTGTNNAQGRTIHNAYAHGYVFRQDNKIQKFNYSNETTSEADMWKLDYRCTLGGFAKHNGDYGYMGAGIDTGDFWRVNFSNSTAAKAQGSNGYAKDYDGAPNGYGDTSIIQIGGNGSGYEQRRLGFFYFSTEKIVATPLATPKRGGEVVPMAGNGFDYNIGGYGVGGQNPYSEKVNQETAVAIQIQNSTYKMSSAANYIN